MTNHTCPRCGAQPGRTAAEVLAGVAATVVTLGLLAILLAGVVFTWQLVL